MKIRLERTLINCPPHLRCTVCRQGFEVSDLRTLLYSDRGLLQGDICSDCMKLRAPEIRKKMREQASLLMQHPEDHPAGKFAAQELAMELLEISQEEVRFPSFYQWWWKKMEIFSQESQELEAVNLGFTHPICGERSRLQKMLEEDSE